MKAGTYARRIWEGLLISAFLILALLPMIDFVARPFGRFHVPSAGTYVQLLTFFLTFLGGLAATASGEHLRLSTAELLGEGRLRRAGDFLASTTLTAANASTADTAAAAVLARKSPARRRRPSPRSTAVDS